MQQGSRKTDKNHSTPYFRKNIHERQYILITTTISTCSTKPEEGRYQAPENVLGCRRRIGQKSAGLYTRAFKCMVLTKNFENVKALKKAHPSVPQNIFRKDWWRKPSIPG
ncbi:MAG: hypothetical protein R2778_06120 [Saprospiraceae bacterium]